VAPAAQYLGDLGCDHIVVRNDERTVAELRALDPRGILVGPGPGEGVALFCACCMRRVLSGSAGLQWQGVEPTLQSWGAPWRPQYSLAPQQGRLRFLSIRPMAGRSLADWSFAV